MAHTLYFLYSLLYRYTELLGRPINYRGIVNTLKKASITSKGSYEEVLDILPEQSLSNIYEIGYKESDYYFFGLSFSNIFLRCLEYQFRDSQRFHNQF
jgi:hypothetical protein